MTGFDAKRKMAQAKVQEEMRAFYTKRQAAQPEQEQMRMPKVGDKVICLEDESLGTVESLTAGGSPDIKFDDGSHGTYLLREFAELFGYATPSAAQPEPPPEWALIKNILAEYGLDAIAFVAEWKAAQPAQEPVKLHEAVINAWSLREVYFDEDGEPSMYRRPPAAQPEQEPVAWAVQGITQMIRGEFAELDAKSKAKRIGGTCVAYPLYTAPVQRTWVGLTDEDMKDPKTHILDFIYGARWAEAKLKERNT